MHHVHTCVIWTIPVTSDHEPNPSMKNDINQHPPIGIPVNCHYHEPSNLETPVNGLITRPDSAGLRGRRCRGQVGVAEAPGCAAPVKTRGVDPLSRGVQLRGVDPLSRGVPVWPSRGGAVEGGRGGHRLVLGEQYLSFHQQIKQHVGGVGAVAISQDCVDAAAQSVTWAPASGQC